MSRSRTFLPVAMFMARASVGAPISDADSSGMVKAHSHSTWPLVSSGGISSIADPNCRQKEDARYVPRRFVTSVVDSSTPLTPLLLLTLKSYRLVAIITMKHTV